MSLVPVDAVKDLAPAGVLRAAINYGNGVLAQRGDNAQEPRGTASDLARELGKRLGVPVHFVSFDGAGGVFDAAKAVPPDPQAWDVAFLAIEPVRAAEIAFTAPYVLIEGTYLVRKDAPYPKRCRPGQARRAHHWSIRNRPTTSISPAPCSMPNSCA